MLPLTAVAFPIGQAPACLYLLFQRLESIVLINRDVQVLVKARHFVLKDGHQSEKDDRFDQVAQTHGALPHLNVELVWHGLFLPFARPVESLSQLVVLLEAHLVHQAEFVGGR